MKRLHDLRLLLYHIRTLWNNPSQDPYARISDVHYEIDAIAHPVTLISPSGKPEDSWFADVRSLTFSTNEAEPQREVL